MPFHVRRGTRSRFGRFRAARETPSLIAAADRIRKLLDWTPRHDSLDAIVSSSLAWERRLMARG